MLNYKKSVVDVYKLDIWEWVYTHKSTPIYYDKHGGLEITKLLYVPEPLAIVISYEN